MNTRITKKLIEKLSDAEIKKIQSYLTTPTIDDGGFESPDLQSFHEWLESEEEG